MSTLNKIDGLIEFINKDSFIICEQKESKESDTKLQTSMISKSPFKLYTSWFCPFAQRVQLALELKNIKYEYIDIDPYNKTKEWLSKNPQGLVPTICDNDNYIYESTVILEYLDDAFPQNEPKLFPNDAYKKAINRIWIDHVNKKIIKPFYQILQYQDDKIKERELAINDYFEQISKYISKMDKIGPYFNGNTPSAVDLIFLPWATRMYLLEYYRGIKYEERFKDKEILNRYNIWYHAFESSQILKNTQKSLTITNEQYPNELIAKYKRYADNTAQSMVAHAINKGKVLP